MYVRDPLILLAAVVEIEHRGDRIDAQSIGMIFSQPVVRARQQEAADLVASEIEYVGTPFRMLALARIEMLIKRGAVETREAERVAREVRRHPVENHSDTALMQYIDQVFEIVRGAEARSRGEIATYLVSPRACERMLHHRHDLDVREPHIGDIVSELMGEFAITQYAVPFFRNSTP